MLLTSRSWLHALNIRRAYTTSTGRPRLKYTHINKKRFSIPTISTFRPEKLVYSDFLVFSGTPRPAFHTQLTLRSAENDSRPIRLNYYQAYGQGSAEGGVESKYDSAFTTKNTNKVKGRFVPFPEHSRGFLYLHQPPPESGLPGQASSIRFRCAPSLVKASSSYIASFKAVKKSKPRSKPLHFLPSSITNRRIYKAFKAGYDLTLPSGVPWSISVLAAASRPSLEYIRLQLLEDNLFSESELHECEDIYKSTSPYRRGVLLYTLDDEFLVRFDKTVFEVWNTTAKDGEFGSRKKKAGQSGGPYGSSCFIGIFRDWRSKYDKKLPYTGAAHVRFELAPDSNISKPALFLRILKIIEPVKCIIPHYDEYVNIPKEGQLVTRGLPGKRRPWICKLDPAVRVHSAMLSLVPGYTANTNLPRAPVHPWLVRVHFMH